MSHFCDDMIFIFYFYFSEIIFSEVVMFMKREQLTRDHFHMTHRDDDENIIITLMRAFTKCC